VARTMLLLVTPNGALYDRVDWQLCGDRDLELLPHAHNGSEMLSIMRTHAVHCVLLDFAALSDHANVLIERIGTTHPGVKCLLLAHAWTEQSVVRALTGGSSGCLQADAPRAELRQAVDAVQRGEMWVSRKCLALAFRELRGIRMSADNGLHRRLSIREREIVHWMRRGMSNKEIARELGISDMTVKTHVHNIFHKLEISGRVRLLGMRLPSEAVSGAAVTHLQPRYRLPVPLPVNRT